jgi:Arylsulfotransferase (ASST)
VSARPRPLPALMLLVAACAGDELTVPTARPVIAELAVGANSYNALSAVATFRATGADSARVLYSSVAEPERATPWQPVRGDVQRIVVLGLLPATTYALRAAVAGPGGTTTSAIVTSTSGAIPTAIQALHLTVTGRPSPGYTLIVPIRFSPDSTTGFVLAFDETGALRWYREVEGGWAVEAKQQPSGNFTVYVGGSYGWAPSYGGYVEVAPSGEEVHRFQVTAPSYTDPHEMLLGFGETGIAAVHLMGYDIGSVDLSAFGGSSSAPLAMHFIQRQSAAGTVEFVWNAGDHYSPADWPSPAVQALATHDLVHPSSLELDRDGNYILSLQAMDEIAKIDAGTGAFLWRFGGRHNQFAIENDPLGGFQGQHSVRVLDDGHLLLLDDRVRSTPADARAVEYEVDTQAMVARLVWQYQPSPPVVSPIMGSVQRLANGNTVVGFGFAGRVDEVDRAGAVVAQEALVSSVGGSIQFYRALRVPSLYAYERP